MSLKSESELLSRGRQGFVVVKVRAVAIRECFTVETMTRENPEDARIRSCIINDCTSSCYYIDTSMHPQPFNDKVSRLSLRRLQISVLKINIKKTMDDAATTTGAAINPGGREARGTKNISAFAAERHFLNPSIIPQNFFGNKNYLSLDSVYLKMEEVVDAGVKRSLMVDSSWVVARCGTLKRKFKDNRDQKIKLERMLQLDVFNPEHKIEDSVQAAQEEEMSKRKRIKTAHKTTLEVICGQGLSKADQGAAIMSALDDYEEKMGESTMMQQQKVAEVIMMKVKSVHTTAVHIKGEINECDQINSLIMTEIMAIKGIVDASDNCSAERRKMLEILENNIPRNLEEFKKRTGLSTYESRWINDKRKAEGRPQLTQAEKSNPAHIPMTDIERVIAASPLKEDDGQIISAPSVADLPLQEEESPTVPLAKEAEINRKEVAEQAEAEQEEINLRETLAVADAASEPDADVGRDEAEEGTVNGENSGIWKTPEPEEEEEDTGADGSNVNEPPVKKQRKQSSADEASINDSGSSRVPVQVPFCGTV